MAVEEEVALAASVTVRCSSDDLKRRLGDMEDGVQGEMIDVAADTKRPRLHDSVVFGPDEELKKADDGDGMVKNKNKEKLSLPPPPPPPSRPPPPPPPPSLPPSKNLGDSKLPDDVKTVSLLAEEDLDLIIWVDIPKDKVRFLIGGEGEEVNILYIECSSGSKIQVLRDAKSVPLLKIFGKSTSIMNAVKLITSFIAEAAARGPGVSELEMQVPKEKVSLIMDMFGDNIKSLEPRPGDWTENWTVRLAGDKLQIETARERIWDVIREPMRQSPSGGYNQQHSYGAGAPAYWGQRGPYDYPPNLHYGPPSYGGYPPQGNMGPGWEQRPPSSMHVPFSQGGCFDYYGGRGHGPGHVSGPSYGPAMGPRPYQTMWSPYVHKICPQASNQPGYGSTASAQTPYPPPYGSTDAYGRVAPA